MNENCGCSQPDMIILPCSGVTGEGRLADRAARELTEEGIGSMFCLAGIAAGISGFVQSAKDCAQIVVIDGCDHACAGTLLKNQDIRFTDHVIVSRLDIRNTDGDRLDPDDVAAVKHAVRLTCKLPVRKKFDAPRPLSPGDRAKSRQLGGKCC